MNLFELKEEIEDTQSDIDYYKDEVLRLQVKTGVKATDCTKEIINSSTLNSKEEALLELAQMSMDLDDAIKKMDNLNRLKNKKYNIFKKHNDYDKQIYTEKRLLKWSNAKISSRHNGISKWSINRICDKIELRRNKHGEES